MIVAETRDGNTLQQMQASMGSTGPSAEFVAEQWLSCLFPALFQIGRDIMFKLANSVTQPSLAVPNVPIAPEVLVQFMHAMLAWKQYETYSSFASRIVFADPNLAQDAPEDAKTSDKVDKQRFGRPPATDQEPVISRLVLPPKDVETNRFCLELLKIMYSFATDKTGRLTGLLLTAILAVGVVIIIILFFFLS
jgi:hypothetical protein